MNRKRQKETTTVVAVFTATAAIATSLLLASDAFAADTKTKSQSAKRTRVSVVHKKKPVYVKMHGDYRVADAFVNKQQADAAAQAALLESERQATLEAEREAQQAQQVASVGTAYVETAPFPYPGAYSYGVPGAVLTQPGVMYNPQTQQYTMPDGVYGGGPLVISGGQGPLPTGNNFPGAFYGYQPPAFFGNTTVTTPNGNTFVIPGGYGPGASYGGGAYYGF